MNVYFASSLTGGREFEPAYQAIARPGRGGACATDCSSGGIGIAVSEAVIDPRDVYARDVARMRACNILIAEVSIPSYGIGYEIAFLLGLGKPVPALYQEKCKISKMISGNSDPYLSVKSYQTPEDAVLQIRKFLNTHKLCL